MLPIVVALLAAFAGVVLLAPVYIGLLQRLGFGKQIRSDGPESHFGKAGTPTMGGMLLVVRPARRPWAGCCWWWWSCSWRWQCGSRTSIP
jgi:UDP-N-acetylmuramyl pentapeptide phosphotransferase/UDP-N-acetylglucosamine-1-phosphate transferase